MGVDTLLAAIGSTDRAIIAVFVLQTGLVLAFAIDAGLMQFRTIFLIITFSLGTFSISASGSRLCAILVTLTIFSEQKLIKNAFIRQNFLNILNFPPFFSRAFSFVKKVNKPSKILKILNPHHLDRLYIWSLDRSILEDNPNLVDNPSYRVRQGKKPEIRNPNLLYIFLECKCYFEHK